MKPTRPSSGGDPRPNPAAPLAPLVLEPIQSRFEAAAAARPNATALVSAKAVWTYGELERVSTALAGRLRHEGLGDGDVIAIVSDRNPALVCAMLAVLKAGAAFALVNEAYPDARVAMCLRVSNARSALLLGAAKRFADSGVASLPLLALPDGAAELELEAGNCPPPPVPKVTEDTVAYLMFTSGSTGEPKCVATGHAPLPHFLAWQRARFGLSEQDRFSMLSGLSHDPLLRDVFAPLSVGGALCIPEPSSLLDPTALHAWLASAEISVAHLTPPLGRVIAAAGRDARLPALRYWFWGGDVLRPQLVQELRQMSPARHVNFYGTTETPQAAGFFEVGELAGVSRIPVGRGIDDFDLLVRTEAGALAAIGELGELCVRTRYLSRGYAGDASASAAKYEINSSTGDAGDRLYRTGDLGMFLPDGSVELRGRADDQVKVRGFRVELAEISTALQRSGMVEEAATLARTSTGGDPQIIAYVTTARGADASPRALADAMKLELPAYMRPAAYVVLSQLPRLPNGKLDRQALLAMPTSAPTTSEAQVGSAPEQALAKIWAEVLGVESVGLHESFYDLGGDSLTAVRVILGMRRSGLDENACRQILQGRTIAQIVSGQSRPADAPRHPAEQRRLVLNALRGIMVMLVVASHWINGIARRLPPFAKLEELANPLLGWPTPGFAIAFGMTLSLIHAAHTTSPARSNKLLLRSALFVTIGVAILAIDHQLLKIFGLLGPNTPLALAHPYLFPFDGVLTYYALALFSAPLWFRLVSGRFLIAKSLALSALMVASFTGLMQLSYEPLSLPTFSVALGKFSYLNLSAGTFGGLALGIAYRSWSRVPASIALLGLVVGGFGAVLSTFDTEASLWGMSGRVELWGWAFWGGLTLVAVYALDRLLARPWRWLDTLGRSLSVIGQLALPLVLLDFVSRDAGNVAMAFGSPMLRLLIPVVLFFAGATSIFKKTYGLYYGADQTIGAAQPLSSPD